MTTPPGAPPPQTDLPESLAYGWVVGRFLVTTGDGPDPDRRPDGRVADGLPVTLTPLDMIQSRVDVRPGQEGTFPAQPGMTTILRQPRECIIGPDGLLRQRGSEEHGVKVITGVYEVTYGSLGRYSRLDPHIIEVTEANDREHPLDLTSARGLPTTPGAGSPVTVLQVHGSPVSGYVVGADGSGLVRWVPADFAPLDHEHTQYLRAEDLPEFPEIPDLSEFVRSDDARLSDARTPTEHDHPEYQPSGDYLTRDEMPEIPDLSGLVFTDDARLSDARPPTAHSHPEYLTAEDVPEFPDLSAFVETTDERLSDARTPLAHEHQIGDVEGLAASLADFQPKGEYLTAGDLPEPPDVSDVIREGDARLSDPRTPTEHRHAWGDLDDIPSIPATPEDIGAQPAGDYATRAEIPEVPPAPDLTGYVTTDDSRLSDARTPTSHRHPWTDLDDVPEIPSEPADIGAQPAGDYLTASDLPAPPDLSDVVREGDPRLSDAREPTEHDHDGRYIRTVNGTGPDGSGNVDVSGGGGEGVIPNALGVGAITSRLEMGRDLTIGVAADSTGDEANEWPRVMTGQLAQRYPAAKVVFHPWDRLAAGGERYGAPVTVQEGEAPVESGHVYISDDFSRTSANLIGSTATGGSIPTWLGNGTPSSNGSHLILDSSNEALVVLAPQQDVKVTAVIDVVTAATVHSHIRFGAAVSNTSLTGYGITGRIQINAGGTAFFGGLTFLSMVNGSRNVVDLSGYDFGWTPNSPDPQRTTFELKVVGLDVTLTVTYQDKVTVISGTLQEQERAEMGLHAGMSTTIGDGQVFKVDSLEIASSATARQQTITVYNGSSAGKMLNWHAARPEEVWPVPLDVLIIALGHNNWTHQPDTFRAFTEQHMETIVQTQPDATVLLMSQNSQDPDEGSSSSEARYLTHKGGQALLSDIAAEHGWLYLGFYEIMVEQFPRPWTVDGLHPLPSLHQFWATTLVDYLLGPLFRKPSAVSASEPAPEPLPAVAWVESEEEADALPAGTLAIILEPLP